MSQASLPSGMEEGCLRDKCDTHDAGPFDRISQPNQERLTNEEDGLIGSDNAPLKGEFCLYFTAEDPSRPLRYHKRFHPITSDEAQYGLHCIVCNSLQSLPSQCRGLAFVHLDEEGVWRLKFVEKLDVKNDKLTFVSMDSEYSILPTATTVRATDFFVRQTVHFVNIYTTKIDYRERFDCLAKLSKYYSQGKFMGGKFDNRMCLEASTTPSKALLKNDINYIFEPRSNKRKRLASKGSLKIKSNHTQNSRKFITIYLKKTRAPSGMDGALAFNKPKHCVVVPSPVIVSEGKRNVSRPMLSLVKGELYLEERHHYIYPVSKLGSLHNKSASEVVTILEKETAENDDCRRFSLFEITHKKPLRFSMVDDQCFERLRSRMSGNVFTIGDNEYIFCIDNRAAQLIEGTFEIVMCAALNLLPLTQITILSTTCRCCCIYLVY